MFLSEESVQSFVYIVLNGPKLWQQALWESDHEKLSLSIHQETLQHDSAHKEIPLVMQKL
uniref:Plant sec1 n=1 Tax=Rhizophora mucronata TaxID=61149 RepID=A0A2P2M8P7_RHIMU